MNAILFETTDKGKVAVTVKNFSKENVLNALCNNLGINADNIVQLSASMSNGIYAVKKDSYDAGLVQCDYTDADYQLTFAVEYITVEMESQATAKYVAEIYVTDPDTDNLIDMAVYKHENEGMICIDASFIEQVAEADEEDDTICYIGDPFNMGGKLKLIESDDLN